MHHTHIKVPQADLQINKNDTNIKNLAGKNKI